MNPPILINTEIKASMDLIWECYTEPAHIVNWNFASKDWICPKAENDFREGGKLNWRMEAKDGSMGFDFCAVYTEIIRPQVISYRLEDGRMVKLRFKSKDDSVYILETFEAEKTHSREMQQAGWQAILDNFKAYVLSLKN